MNFLEGAVALVTGASSGIGESIARVLALKGINVSLIARREEQLRKISNDILDLGGQALPITADIGNREEALEAVNKTIDKFGRLDILINNAGIMHLGLATDAFLSEWEEMINTNIQGLLNITHASIPHLIKTVNQSNRKITDIVNISSVAGRKATAGASVYNLTKHGLGAFSESLRQELSNNKVRVSLIEPGSVKTEIEKNLREEAYSPIKNNFNNHKHLDPLDIAHIIEYIISCPSNMAINEIMVRPF
ncbi:SDR family NAD(P)-dependent oxidoreductase [Paenibacillus dendritiformis]|uniref:SDR family oxidoreductase n=1 Tax=Paenibacillus dendritiformis TaxID=130049 RepID=UPI00248C2A4A|nr:SDR family NAD(P)-dependent oxidoreductase [Paenibacillus dendritiformis]WGU94843.1 SDR family NAD(P)-dependent oxidoreductase [Paenibacillus dendritiformis]